DAEQVRQVLLQDKQLTKQKLRVPEVKFDQEVEIDSLKFIGAYLGQLTPLQYAIMLEEESIAKDIVERSFDEDLDTTCGGQNTALHLATFLCQKDVVKSLLERGADFQLANSKGFAPVDVMDDPDMRQIYEQFKDA
ncbi:hypothetical protein EDD86DRAFT_187667, partial [Gorgonomyces haynaldii]